MAIAASIRHWRVLAPLVGLLVLLALWSLYWLWGSGEAQRQVAEVRAELARNGLDFACAGDRHGGYPFRFSFTCAGPDLAKSDGWRATAGELEVLVQAWDPGHLILRLAGPVRLAMPDGLSWNIAHTPAVASLIVRRVGVQGSLVAEQVKIDGPAGEALGAERLSLHIRLPEVSLTEGIAASPAADFAVFATALDLLQPPHRALRVDKLEAEANLSVLPWPLPASLVEGLKTAAAAGAELSLTRFVASAEAVDVDATGTVHMTAGGLPTGRVAMRFNDLKALFARLAERRIMATKTADGAAVLVGLLTAAGTVDGKRGPVDLVFKNGAIFWGPFRLASHGPLF